MSEALNAHTASPLAVAVEPFRFKTSLILQEATGLRASTLAQLSTLLREVPESCIYHHTHYFLLQHHYLTPEPSHDIAYWVSEVLGEQPLGELLAGIDTVGYADLKTLREALVTTIDDYRQRTPTAGLRFVSEGSEFFFLKSIRIIMPTPYVATTLKEFARALEHVSIRSLYFHIFDARLRLGRPANDFSVWLGEQLGLKELAQRVVTPDPYAYTLEALRSTLLSMLQHELKTADEAHADPR
ncbi:MAG: hypothetical protein HY352_00270 [Candidatus Omnitrophica bacterium]|nr:hypothetical protein [Candidatus Omnitrophota bacterium]